MGLLLFVQILRIYLFGLLEAFPVFINNDIPITTFVSLPIAITPSVPLEWNT